MSNGELTVHIKWGFGRLNNKQYISNGDLVDSIINSTYQMGIGTGYEIRESTGIDKDLNEPDSFINYLILLE
jgi:hypothetical protein